MRIILHLGTYKTGTTSIQNHLWANRATLLERGVLFPRTGVSETWHIGHRHNRFLYGKPAANAAIADKLIREIRDSGAQKVILSYEAWCNLANIGRFDTFLRQLEAAGLDDLHGVLALRNRARYAVSHYREFTVHQNNRRPYGEYIEQRLPVFDYGPTVQALQGVLDGRLGLIAFDDHADIFPAFCKAAGLPEALDLPLTPRGNVKSVDALDIEGLRMARVGDLDLERLPAVMEEFRAHHADTPEWTERFVGDLSQPLPGQLSRFARMTGWDEAAVHALLSVPPPTGRNVAEVGDELRRHLVRALA